MAGPETNNTETPYPIWGFGPPSSEPDTKKLDALLASLNSSAERFQTLWFSFLGLTLYLAIAALATTHRNLLLGEPQTLPILNIKVELLPFYVIAPLLYLVFHFYLLMMLALLARTAAEFDKQLRVTIPGKTDRERYRAQVGNALFLQLLVGMRGERAGVNALLMGLIALITIVLAPLATLVLMQMMFLPYHHLRITWWHRAVVVADLVLIVVMTYRCFFPRGIRKAPLVLGALSRKPRWVAAIAFYALLIVALVPLVDWLSFRQGRWAGEPPPSSFSQWSRWMAGERPSVPAINPDYAATESGIVFGLFPDRLKLNNEMIVGERALEEIKKEIAGRGGDFVPTIKLDDRDLQAADFSGADLRGASLSEAAMQGAKLVGTRLDGAVVNNAQLEGANLRGARARGVQLGGAKLQGARLAGAQLEDANLGGAQLKGSELSFAKLQGANLIGSSLEGADLFIAQLEGADLAFARLQGADLKGAQLQGAHLTRSETDDSEFDETFVFRTDTNDVSLSAAVAQLPQADGVKVNERGINGPITSTDLDMWIAAATEFVGDREKVSIAERFARLKPAFQTSEQDAADHAKWVELARQSSALDPTRAQHRRRLAAILGDLACEVEGAPYVARVLIGEPSAISRGQGSISEVFGERRDGVLERLRSARDRPQTCPGIVGFTEADWRRLKPIKLTARTPAGQ
jgi:uncharacterized protein YjbI with pentapeptide repeats